MLESCVASHAQEEIVAWVRRRSSAFSRGRSRFRGVSGQAGHWEARIGTFGDRKNVRHPTARTGPTLLARTDEDAMLARHASSVHTCSTRPSSQCQARQELIRRHVQTSCQTYGQRSPSKCLVPAQVSFGIHETEEEAARQYDRALIVEKGRAAKTNFPIVLYEEEVAYFEASIASR